MYNNTPATLYAGTTLAGLMKTTDAGVKWNVANEGFLRRKKRPHYDPRSWFSPFDLRIVGVVGLVIDPTAPTTLYAGTSGLSSPRQGAVFKSTDGGATWTALLTDRDFSLSAVTTQRSANPSESSYWIDIRSSWTQLAVHPTTSGTLYAAAGDRVLRSIDGGSNWKAVFLHHASVLAIDPTTPDTLYVGTSAEVQGERVGQVFKSSDRGENWAAINTGLMTGYVAALAIDPTEPHTLYAGTFPSAIQPGGWVYKSIDGGASWKVSDTGLR